MLSGGKASFKIRLAVLSSQRDGKKFRVSVGPAGAADGQELSIKAVISEPMRTITKLHRGPRTPAPAEDAPERQRTKRRAASDASDESMLGEDGCGEHDKASLADLQDQVEMHGQTLSKLLAQNQKLVQLLEGMRAEYARKRAKTEA